MATILLDSSVIFDHLNGRSGRTELLLNLLERGHVLACCPVNITEVYAGLRPGEEAATRTFLDSLEFIPISKESAQAAGDLKRKWGKKGKTLSYTDVTIAAVAIDGGLPLLTDNKKHFPMPEIDLLPLP